MIHIDIGIGMIIVLLIESSKFILFFIIFLYFIGTGVVGLRD